jgi:hypothetical protein
VSNHLADIIGMLGTANIVGAYMLLQFNRIDAKGLAFNCINLCGAILLLISLLVNFNLASFVIEVFWIAASLVGLVRYYQRRRQGLGS